MASADSFQPATTGPAWHYGSDAMQSGPHQAPSHDNGPQLMTGATDSLTSAEKPKPIKFVYSHARLPLRVHINKHDSTDSIISSVKTFFGIHDGMGVSFENEGGNNIIPRYENVASETDIQVRLTQDMDPVIPGPTTFTASPSKSIHGLPWITMPAPQLSRPASRNAKGRESSPDSARKHRSLVGKPVPLSKSSRQLSTDDLSDSDGGSVSVTSSRRDILASAEVSAENIIEGSRRKGAKFESSELPLFMPPQMPLTASVSSASPQKRFNPSAASPHPPAIQRGFPTPSNPYPSPYSYSLSDKVSTFSNSGHSYAKESNVRGSAHTPAQPSRLSGGSGSGIFPTPAPTIGSAISDEDVALQLMRLGDPGNAPPPRPSASTPDDALSGKAELASSAEYSDSESEGDMQLPQAPVRSGPAKKKLKTLDTALASADTYSSGEEYEDFNDGTFKGDSDELMRHISSKKAKHKARKQPKSRSASGHSRISTKFDKTKAKPSQTPNSAIPPSPYSLPPGQSKASTITQFASDEEDLSAKPRCQRCRKSKKGCDRQRPCGRCKDAGIGLEGCVSEDEGNGRKGRFGRHMGVAVKKSSLESMNSASPTQGSIASFEPGVAVDAGKKRKR